MMDYLIAFMIIVVAIFIWDWFEKPKPEDKKHCSEEEIALAEFLEKRQEINQLFWLLKQKCEKFQENKRIV